jgi:hypothetical protein
MLHLRHHTRSAAFVAATTTALGTLLGSPALGQLFNTDVIVQGSLCVGIDCVNGENFGYDTLRLKENNVRIKFEDTSGTGTFPTNDWELTANDSSNGGAERFSITDITAGRAPFTVAAGADANSLYVGSNGNVGMRTGNPAMHLHIVDGNSPTVRLEQDGSDGFGAQIWDIAGNETNFFIRDVTNASRLFFRSTPGAPENSIFIAADGDIGLGTNTPNGALHVRRSTADMAVPMTLLEGDMANNQAHMVLRATDAAGRAEIWFEDGSTAGSNDAMRMQLRGNKFNIVHNGSGGGLRIHQNSNVEVPNGDLIVSGTIRSGGVNLNVPDYVFAPDYQLMPLGDVAAFIDANSHLPHVPSAAEVQANGLDLPQMQMAILKTVEELVLHTLDQQDTIGDQAATIAALEARLEVLERR